MGAAGGAVASSRQSATFKRIRGSDGVGCGFVGEIKQAVHQF
ncbi:MAG: hypothetical protein ACKERG_00085 [Candidatus Hodgkinia cicadicola]